MRKFLKQLAAILIGILATGCTYDTIIPKDPEVPAVVSFDEHIIPIFNAQCNSVGCHNQGGIPPDLSEENAWFSLVFFDYVDTLAPPESLLYKKINIGGSMEQFASDEDRALILEWITQGAKNN